MQKADILSKLIDFFLFKVAFFPLFKKRHTETDCRAIKPLLSSPTISNRCSPIKLIVCKYAQENTLLSLFSITNFVKALWILTERQDRGLFIYLILFELNTKTTFLPHYGKLVLINFTFQSVTQDLPPALNCPLSTQSLFLQNSRLLLTKII